MFLSETCTTLLEYFAWHIYVPFVLVKSKFNVDQLNSTISRNHDLISSNILNVKTKFEKKRFVSYFWLKSIDFTIFAVYFLYTFSYDQPNFFGLFFEFALFSFVYFNYQYFSIKFKCLNFQLFPNFKYDCTCFRSLIGGKIKSQKWYWKLLRKQCAIIVLIIVLIFVAIYILFSVMVSSNQPKSYDTVKVIMSEKINVVRFMNNFLHEDVFYLIIKSTNAREKIFYSI